mmetsp:Transcript_21273/g.64011  ORF Transcript_21273/g.64011 Transcript_21273/m.64011 type:complete len:170 (+) Transcript_21273:543-1052(+)
MHCFSRCRAMGRHCKGLAAVGHQVCLQAGLQVSKRHSTGAARVIQKCKQAASPPQANGGMTSLCGRCLYSSSSGSGSGIFMSLKSFPLLLLSQAVLNAELTTLSPRMAPPKMNTMYTLFLFISVLYTVSKTPAMAPQLIGSLQTNKSAEIALSDACLRGSHSWGSISAS